MQRQMHLPLIVGLWLFSLALSANILAEPLGDQFPPATGSADEKFRKAFTSQLEKLQQSWDPAQPLPKIWQTEKGGIRCLFEAPYSAQMLVDRQQQIRFLVGRLVIQNETEQPLECELKNLVLQTGTGTHRLNENLDKKGYGSVNLKGSHFSLSEFESPEKLVIPAGQISSCWLLFLGLDAGLDVPQMKLEFELVKTAYQLDIRQQWQTLLEWKKEQIGPQNILAIGNIGGELNTINIGDVIDELTLLSTQQITRVVLNFEEQASKLDQRVSQWVSDAAERAGQTSNNRFQDLPFVPAMIQKLHIAEKDKLHSSHSNGLQKQIHERLSDAVIAAAGSAYEVIPIKDLAIEVQQGHPLSRCAALTYAADRLPTSMLPAIIEMTRFSESSEETESENEPDYRLEICRAALGALAAFPQAESIARLREIAIAEDEQLSLQALVSLASSRFPAHYQTLLELLDQPLAIQQRVVQAMSIVPRQLWAETLYQYAQQGPMELQSAAIQALDQIGHPGLNPLLVALLEGPDTKLQEIALSLLSSRTDSDSQQRVIEYALTKLKTSAHSDAIDVVVRLKVQPAIPLLLDLFRNEKENRQPLIHALREIGDDRILDDLIEAYPDLNESEKTEVLETIAVIDHNRFLDFASKEIKTSEGTVLQKICRTMQEQPDPQAIQIIIEAIEQETDDDHDDRIIYLIQALGSLSSPESRAALLELRENGSKTQQTHARNALQNLYYRSPANYIVQQAQNTLKSNNYKLAIDQFSLAIDADPGHPPAWLGRGDAHRFLQQYAEAVEDYQKLLQIDSAWPGGQAACGQALTSLSKFAEAIPYLDRAINQDGNNPDNYSSRGHAYSMLEQFEPAEKDYRKALELNPKHMTALTGVALSLAIKGEQQEAMKTLEEGRKLFGENSIFAYNAACTYARAAEYVQNQSQDGPQKLKQIKQLITSALDELDRSVKLGYSDSEWTKNDPDLKILRENERFAQAIEQMKLPKSQRQKSSPDDEDS